MKTKMKRTQQISNPFKGKELIPIQMLNLLKNDETNKWHAIFCKILIRNCCLSYTVNMKKTNDGILITTRVTNKHGFTFNISGSDWSYLCISASKFMSDYFEMESKEDLQAKLKYVMEAFRKQNR